MRKRKVASAISSAVAISLTSVVGIVQAEAAPAGVCKEITVLTNRTDIAPTTFTKVYGPAFTNGPGKGTKVKFQSYTNYDQDVRTMMNTKNYGDVLGIPKGVTPAQFPKFFTALGKDTDLAKTYRFVSEGSYNGKAYGLAQTGNAGGYAVNLKAWAAAGVTTPPGTPAEFIVALKKIKASNPDVIPLYTNYKTGWAPTAWSNAFTGHSQGVDSQNLMAKDSAPFKEGNDAYTGLKILFDAVAAGVTEKDPTTTDWESSKPKINKGEIATMFLGSWSVSQFKGAGPNAADIGFYPIPVKDPKSGKFLAYTSGDVKQAINKNSKCQASAKAWLTYFLQNSGYAYNEGGINPYIKGPNGESYTIFDKFKVEYRSLKPAPAGKESLFADVTKAAGIPNDGTLEQNIIDTARGAKDGTFAAIISDLNTKWASGVKAAS
jgi:raffinose/stachyose/melibiose transport system substrate-binding protein